MSRFQGHREGVLMRHQERYAFRMSDELLHVPLTAEQLHALTRGDDSMAGRQARAKLQLWAGDEFGVGLWLRVEQVWQRPNGRKFLIAGFAATGGQLGVKTVPLSKDGRPSELNALRLAGAAPDPHVPALLSTPAPSPWVLTVRAVSGRGPITALLDAAGPSVAGARPLRGELQLELNELDEVTRRHLEAQAELASPGGWKLRRRS